LLSYGRGRSLVTIKEVEFIKKKINIYLKNRELWSSHKTENLFRTFWTVMAWCQEVWKTNCRLIRVYMSIIFTKNVSVVSEKFSKKLSVQLYKWSRYPTNKINRKYERKFEIWTICNITKRFCEKLNISNFNHLQYHMKRKMIKHASPTYLLICNSRTNSLFDKSTFVTIFLSWPTCQTNKIISGLNLLK